MTPGATRPRARAGQGTLTVSDDRVFGPGGEALARSFAQRVLSFNDVHSLAFDPARARATLNYQLTAPDDAGSFLTRLANAVAVPTADANQTELPHWPDAQRVTLYRHSDLVSIFPELNIARGYLTARHPAIERNDAIARRVETALRAVPGVIQAAVTGELRAHFDPKVVAAPQLIRMAEAEILERETLCLVPSPERVNFGLANVTLGVAAVGEFVLPLVAPVASGLLVLAALGTRRTRPSAVSTRACLERVAVSSIKPRLSTSISCR